MGTTRKVLIYIVSIIGIVSILGMIYAYYKNNGTITFVSAVLALIMAFLRILIPLIPLGDSKTPPPNVISPSPDIYTGDLAGKIKTKDDVTRFVTAPFLGIIPIVKNDFDDPIYNTLPVLRIRSQMQERFRAVIHNLNILLKNENKKIITVTSYKNGEGKSFFARNLAMTLAMIGKKTLLVDLDLRKSVLIKTLRLCYNNLGIAAFFSDPSVEITEVIDTSREISNNLDIIPVHVFPPNPAELLTSNRLSQLFQSIEIKGYDYVIVDTPPVGLIVDVYDINPYVSATIFLLRSNYSLKKILPEVQELYKDKKLNNLSVVLNAVKEKTNIFGIKDNYGYD